MKKYFILIILLFVFFDAFPQLSIRGSMGIEFQSTPSLTDYLNAIPGVEEADFSSAVIFSGEAAYPITPNTEIALELAYLINSYTYSDIGIELKYGILMPSIIYSYVIRGTGYNFKFGGGAGIRLASVDYESQILVPNTFSSTGAGFILRSEGNTSLGGKLYANIGAELRYDLNGEPESNGMTIRNDIFDENLNLNSFSAGIRIGLSYQF